MAKEVYNFREQVKKHMSTFKWLHELQRKTLTEKATFIDNVYFKEGNQNP